MITRSQLIDKTGTQKRSERKGNMKNENTYKLLIQSEEKSRNILETAIYGLVALSVILTIWQFAEQPLEIGKATIDQRVAAETIA